MATKPKDGRGGGRGTGQGAGKGGRRTGPRDGTGPRGKVGTCLKK